MNLLGEQSRKTAVWGPRFRFVPLPGYVTDWTVFDQTIRLMKDGDVFDSRCRIKTHVKKHTCLVVFMY